MHLRVPLVILCLLSLALLPLASADHAPSCASVTDPLRVHWFAAPDTPAVHTRLHDGHVELWAEDNGVAGLQRVACTTNDGAHAPADTLLHAQPIPRPNGLCVGSICLF